ncbi:MAG: hypothetical protein ABR525_11220 [Candidatus Limnocylindria bacterium]
MTAPALLIRAATIFPGSREEGERRGTLEAWQYRERGVLERAAAAELVLEEMDHDLGVRF